LAVGGEPTLGEEGRKELEVLSAGVPGVEDVVRATMADCGRGFTRGRTEGSVLVIGTAVDGVRGV
jgi:hypothetical protein